MVHQLRRRHAEQLGGPVVDAQEPLIGSDGHVGVGCLLVKIAVAPLALEETLLDPEALELDGRPGGEDPEDREPAGLGRQGPLVEDRQVAQHLALDVEQRHAEVALDPQIDEVLISGEFLADAAGMMAQSRADHVLAGGPGQVEFDIVQDRPFAPVRQGPRPHRRAVELGDEGVIDAHGRGQVPDQRLEERGADALRRPLHNGPQGGQLIVVQRLGPGSARRGVRIGPPADDGVEPESGRSRMGLARSLEQAIDVGPQGLP